MDIGINEVKDIIESLQSNGELSIKEEKYLKVAKLCVQLAAENVGLRETVEAVRGVADNSSGIAGWHLNGDIATWGEILPEIDDLETPATDRILAEAEARGVEKFAAKLRIPGDDQFFDALAKGVALSADDFAKQLREGEDK